MLEFPRWKYWLVAIVLTVAAVFALPNVFGEDAALQMVRKDRAAVSADTVKAVRDSLATQGVTVTRSY
ncbi:MAG: protein translocase subunit SecD, partial [Gammaproteobacteria bacterium]